MITPTQAIVRCLHCQRIMDIWFNGCELSNLVHKFSDYEGYCMNSSERHEARYQRRKAKRESKKPAGLDDFDKVFTFENLYNAYKKCRLGVGWKASTQKYTINAVFNVYRAYKQLHTGTYKTGNFYEFNIVERGKARHIRSVHISERVIQKCLCDCSLVETLSRSFITDNGACQKGKGEHFALNRLEKQLHDYYKQHKTNKGYILLFDFSKFFDNINHDKLKEILKSKYEDQRLLSLLYKLIDDFGDIGLGLGSQISQICALGYPNTLDHYIKEKLRIKAYGRYMDDGYLISDSKEYLLYCLQELKKLCEEQKIILHERKTHLQKLDRQFTFLKKRFIFTDTGKVVRLPPKNSTTRMRRKLKKLAVKYKNGQMKLEDIQQSIQSWMGSMRHSRSYRQIREIKKLYQDLFKEKLK